MMTGKEARITFLIVLDTFFFLLEAIVGYSVHSLALVADSFHMLNDIISLVIALWAVRYKNTKPADGKYTYGWQRAEILGALINAVFLLALCFTIVLEAIQRFFEPQEITQPKLILIVGICGLLSNGVGLVLFHEHGHSHSHGGSEGNHGHSHGDIEAGESDVANESHDHSESNSDLMEFMPNNVVGRYNENSPLIKNDNAGKNNVKRKSMNMEGVFLHVLGDALGNVGVIATALFIWKTDYSWRFYFDPVISLLITVIIFTSALSLCRKSSKILLQATPAHVNSNLILNEIIKLESVKSVHDFHIWNLNEDILIASLHVELNHGPEVNNTSNDTIDQIDRVTFVNAVTQVREILHRFGIHSATIQPEFSNGSKKLKKKASAYGQTNIENCIVDGASGCDNDQCLK
ncbi:DEHA2G03278p [Debaryomyces hansenii CBS767]|uniref:DEHA2G03278p n=1 Tax=Debaryomyces hansenii (strain ATCC 36239 / CBS 767 / BCRC 21394 / JCM 1990 / NBRC 0083 / IGC 2968) TaxID=284592 RepID=Q6BJD3_DEBHA|nr:DEHA2G03278p [Debaryomyces hansenii CBS767]CAG90136.1 DEHA2G03278p [Debaryomyces hansenii CBS767]|eukprot:XP_461688.1 DEHA2G03278p [Debaryomyces hansenii CBS767]